MKPKSAHSALVGFIELNNSLGINYSGQVTADEIESSYSRTRKIHEPQLITKLSVLPEYCFNRDSRESVTVRAGAAFDDTNRGRFSTICDQRYYLATHHIPRQTLRSATSPTQKQAKSQAMVQLAAAKQMECS